MATPTHPAASPLRSLPAHPAISPFARFTPRTPRQAAAAAAASRARQHRYGTLLRLWCDQHALASSATRTLRRWQGAAGTRRATRALASLAPPGRAEQPLFGEWGKWTRARLLWLRLGALGCARFARSAVMHAWGFWTARYRVHEAVRRAVDYLRAGGLVRGWRKLRAGGREWARVQLAVRSAVGRHEGRALRAWLGFGHGYARQRRLRLHALDVWLGGVRRKHLTHALGAWRVWCGSDLKQRALQAMQRIRRQREARALTSWREIASALRCTRQQLRGAAERWRRACGLGLFAALCALRAAAAEADAPIDSPKQNLREASMA